MEVYDAVLNAARLFLISTGSVIIALGITLSVPAARGPGGRARVARRILEHAALGLDYFVGATILNLVLTPTLSAAATTALTIAVRKTLTFSLRLATRPA